LRWHHNPIVGLPRYQRNEPALGRLAGNDGETTVAAAKYTGEIVEPQSVPLLFGSVAGNAVFGKDGKNVAIEEVWFARRFRPTGRQYAERHNYQAQSHIAQDIPPSASS
jgi:hypothetical protein